MRQLILILLFLISFSSFSQKDTVISNEIYTSYYSYTFCQPLKVEYKLYKGGGNCNRVKEKFNFKKDTILKNINISDKDYAKTGYDEGHFANAEDFAYDCKKEELTFRFYNCVPQDPKLNRGVWKSNETKIRKLSQKDSLFIICGAIITKNSRPVKSGSKLKIPQYCYKIVTSLSTKKLIQCTLFENKSDSIKTQELTIKQLNTFIKKNQIK